MAQLLLDTAVSKALEEQRSRGSITQHAHDERLLVLLNEAVFERVASLAQRERRMRYAAVDSLALRQCPVLRCLLFKEGQPPTTASVVRVTLNTFEPSRLVLFLHQRAEHCLFLYAVEGMEKDDVIALGILPGQDPQRIDQLVTETLVRGERPQVDHGAFALPLFVEQKHLALVPVGEPGLLPKAFPVTPELREALDAFAVREYLEAEHLRRSTKIEGNWTWTIVRWGVLGGIAATLSFGIAHIFERFWGKLSNTAHSAREIEIASLLAFGALATILLYELARGIGWTIRQSAFFQRQEVHGPAPMRTRWQAATRSSIRWLAPLLKLMERVVLSPWILGPVIVAILLFGLTAVERAAREPAFAYLGQTLALYQFVLFYLLSLSFYGIIRHSLQKTQYPGRFESVQYAGFAHFRTTRYLWGWLIGAIPRPVKRGIVAALVVLAFLPYVGGILASTTQSLLDRDSTWVRVFWYVGFSPRLLIYGFFVLLVLAVGASIILGGWAEEGVKIIISGIFVVVMGCMVILYPQIFWRSNPSMEPSPLLRSLLPAAGVLYRVLQVLAQRIASHEMLATRRELLLVGIWLVLLVSHLVLGLLYPVIAPPPPLF